MTSQVNRRKRSLRLVSHLMTIGNVSNTATAGVLLKQADLMEPNGEHPEASFLLLNPSRPSVPPPSRTCGAAAVGVPIGAFSSLDTLSDNGNPLTGLWSQAQQQPSSKKAPLERRP